MHNVPGTTPVYEPGGDTIDPEAQDTPTNPAMSGSMFTTLPGDYLDAARLRARSATYRNSEEERAMIDAVDRAAFAQVQAIENQLIAVSTGYAERERARLKTADTAFDQLLALTRRVERGESPSALVQEYKKVTAEVQATLRHLDVAARHTEAQRKLLADPYAHTQKVLSLMPHNSGAALHAIDPTPYLR